MSLYPDNPLVDDSYPINEQLIEILKNFKDKKTFKLSDSERSDAMRVMVTQLAQVFSIVSPTLICHSINGIFSGNSSYIHNIHTICMTGRLSIITLLHEFGHALGYDEFEAVRFSVNLFKRVYPKQFAKLVAFGHCLIKQGS